MSLPSDESRSFGSIADQYNRLRPSPPPAAIDWLLPDRATLAVEPDTRMSKGHAAEPPPSRRAARAEPLHQYRDGIVHIYQDDPREAINARFPGATEVDLPMRSLCWRADRIAR